MRILERMHPLCCFVYLLLTAGITIFTRNPVLLLESAIGAALLLAASGKGAFALWIPLIVLVGALTNPLFSHNGATVLFFAGDIPVTMESAVYGAVFGLMLAAVCGWSISSVRFITSDKYIWLFGRILPSAGLVLSCGLRFVPLFIRRTKSFAEAQGAQTVKEHLRAFSASVSYSAEEAMSSADSMKARGYGSAKRTSFSLYRLGMREISALAAILLTGISAIILIALGAGEFYYFPALSQIGARPLDIVLYIAFGILCLLPSAAAVCEELKRRRGYLYLTEETG
ncbi:MAG: hypothetical protein IJO91_03040 [Oscillospiraceae bacterium]|nr:hypothetical protein [Oscillospiraceae bacterium]